MSGKSSESFLYLLLLNVGGGKGGGGGGGEGEGVDREIRHSLTQSSPSFATRNSCTEQNQRARERKKENNAHQARVEWAQSCVSD